VRRDELDPGQRVGVLDQRVVVFVQRKSVLGQYDGAFA